MTSIYVHPPTIEPNEAEIGRSEPASLAIPGVLDVKTSSVLERMFRDARCGRFHPANPLLTHEIVAKTTLGISLGEQPRWG